MKKAAVATALPISDRRAKCISLMKWQLNIGAHLITQLLDEMAEWPTLPASLDINGEAWLEAEAAIDRAANAGDMKLVHALCDDYRARVEKFCNFYRAKYGAKEAA